MIKPMIRIGRHASRTSQAARKAGIDLTGELRESNTNIIEQEQADIT